MFNFVKCPCCAGHETISAEAAGSISKAIEYWLEYLMPNDSALTELQNIRNAILNQQERKPAIDPLLE